MSGKRYPEEFKIEAVRQVVDRGYRFRYLYRLRAPTLGKYPLQSLCPLVRMSRCRVAQGCARAARLLRPFSQQGSDRTHRVIGFSECTPKEWLTAVQIPGAFNMTSNETTLADRLRVCEPGSDSLLV